MVETTIIKKFGSPEDFIVASLNLKNLKLKIDLVSRYATQEEQIIADSIASQIKCEYIVLVLFVYTIEKWKVETYRA